MTMSKEIERLKSKLEFCETLLCLYNNLKIEFNSNDYDKTIEEYQNRIAELYKRLQEFEEVNNE